MGATESFSSLGKEAYRLKKNNTIWLSGIISSVDFLFDMLDSLFMINDVITIQIVILVAR